MPVDTKKSQRRALRFANLAEVRAEVDRLAAAARAGTVRTTGNWSVGQVFGHLAAWIDFAYDGFPAGLNPPWFIKFLLKFRKKSFLYGEMPVGVRIPGQAQGTKATEELSLEDGYARFTRALERLERTAPTQPSVIFGPMTHAEWKALNLRHAELHLGFLHPTA